MKPVACQLALEAVMSGMTPEVAAALAWLVERDISNREIIRRNIARVVAGEATGLTQEDAETLIEWCKLGCPKIEKRIV